MSFDVILDHKTILVESMIPTKDDIIREEILREAQQLFRQYGVKKTTMEDIAKAMGKGKSTLYYYYCSKEEIFDAVILKEMGEVFNQVKQAVAKAVTAEDKLRAFTLTKIKAVQKYANLYKIVKGEMQENLHCMKHLHTEYDTHEIKLVKEILKYGVSNGEFSKVIGKELGILPSVMVSSLRGLERDMFIDARYAKLEPRMESIMAIMIRGLKSDPV
ncbi:MAG: TetR/AcrR family transcriptional regulator [Chitinophagaceae bacterium]|nr:MAG: TetR/AcrR family transcriptional regulator [Chitinophagaceae bacterium]